jgi:Icc-related predicted phosphoesterase
MKICAISDLHGNLNMELDKDIDILTVSGDICPCRGSHHPVEQLHWINNHFIPWARQAAKHTVFIAGNHDFVFEKMMKDNGEEAFRKSLPKNVHYLRDSKVTIKGVKIYGTPWTPIFYDWAFMRSEEDLNEKFNKIPGGMDIVISHGPAKGHNDIVLAHPHRADEHLGSSALYANISRAMPKWLFVGHIHTGEHKISEIIVDNKVVTNSVNVSILDERYDIFYHSFGMNL